MGLATPTFLSLSFSYLSLSNFLSFLCLSHLSGAGWLGGNVNLIVWMLRTKEGSSRHWNTDNNATVILFSDIPRSLDNFTDVPSSPRDAHEKVR